MLPCNAVLSGREDWIGLVNLLIAFTSRYYRTPDGAIWTTTVFDSEMWQEYLEVSEELELGLLARVIDVQHIPYGARRADCPGVAYHGLPEWRTVRLPILYWNLNKVARTAVRHCDAAILFSPSFEAGLAFRWANKLQKPVALECLGEQSMNRRYLEKRGLPLPLAAAVARYQEMQFVNHLKHSWGCVFVAEQLRQRFTATATNQEHWEVIMDCFRWPDKFFTQPREYSPVSTSPLKIINIGRLEAQKDQTTLLEACALLKNLSAPNWELHLVGAGPLEGSLKEAASRLDLAEQVIFHGYVPWGDPLFSLLSKMDLFVLSSISEGMPRVLLHAMACGLPCISTRVSGATELLDDDALVPIGDVNEMARCIARFAASADLMNHSAERCWEKVQAFRADRLRERKQAFLRDFLDYARRWQKGAGNENRG